MATAIPHPPQSPAFGRPLALLAILGTELCLASIAFDTKDLQQKGAFVGFVGRMAPVVLRLLTALTGALIVFGIPRWKSLAPRFRAELAAVPVKWQWLGVHAILASLIVPLSMLLFWGHPPEAVFPWLLAGVIVLCGMAALAAVRGLIPFSILEAGARVIGFGWVLAPAIVGAAMFGGALAQAFWKPSASLAFPIVRSLLQPFIPRLVADSATFTIGSERFSVIIAPECSGYEGVGLVLLFAAGWLWYFRHEYRFPAALLLAPAAALVMWVVNCFRIAGLIIIGHLGWEHVAMGGFHSQAGWIAFILVAIGLCYLSMRVPVFAATVAGGSVRQQAATSDAAPYLVPFLAILAMSMLSRALSGTFEWLYPLRIAAAAGALWHYRREYGAVDWKFGPASLLLGGLVFALWVGLDRSATAGMSPELIALPWPYRAGWIAFRIVGAVITVPIAEELAFRGFLMRRIASADFGAVPWRSFAPLPLLVSSIAFGAMHGGRWIEGSLAGALYALAVARTGRLGDAVAAHAATNAMLAGWVLLSGHWQYW